MMSLVRCSSAETCGGFNDAIVSVQRGTFRIFFPIAPPTLIGGFRLAGRARWGCVSKCPTELATSARRREAGNAGRGLSAVPGCDVLEVDPIRAEKQVRFGGFGLRNRGAG